MWLSPKHIICLAGCIAVDNSLRIDEDLSDKALPGLRKQQAIHMSLTSPGKHDTIHCEPMEV